MSLIRPDLDDLRRTAGELGLTFGPEEIASIHAMMAPSLAAYEALDSVADNVPLPRRSITPSRRPDALEDPHHAWYQKTRIEGAARGPLAGRTVAVKDNICVAGVPMMNGSATLEGYVPEVDATIVTRLLEAGGTIIGKTNCEHFCLSAGSHTNSKGPTRNPHGAEATTGGSSSGSAAAVAAAEVDMAVGCDQGGSIRVPASFCGIYGMKPTYGLVPFSGIMPGEVTLDHAGPMTRTVADNALMLEVMAGPDGLDPRQTNAPALDYRAGLKLGAAGLRIGVLVEGFKHSRSEPDVDAKVLTAARLLGESGAEVVEVSVPMHRLGMAIWTAIAAEGETASMMLANGFGHIGRGLYVTSLMAAHAEWRNRTADLSDTLKLVMMMGRYVGTRHGGHYYAKGQNLARALKAAYDDALTRCDLLIMPTSIIKPPPLPPSDASPAVRLMAAAGELSNAAPFDCSGHPALSAPCGKVDGLPVGMMFVGRHHDEPRIYQAAAAFEAQFDWTEL